MEYRRQPQPRVWPIIGVGIAVIGFCVAVTACQAQREERWATPDHPIIIPKKTTWESPRERFILGTPRTAFAMGGDK